MNDVARQLIDRLLIESKLVGSYFTILVLLLIIVCGVNLA